MKSVILNHWRAPLRCYIKETYILWTHTVHSNSHTACTKGRRAKGGVLYLKPLDVFDVAVQQRTQYHLLLNPITHNLSASCHFGAAWVLSMPLRLLYKMMWGISQEPMTTTAAGLTFRLIIDTYKWYAKRMPILLSVFLNASHSAGCSLPPNLPIFNSASLPHRSGVWSGL